MGEIWCGTRWGWWYRLDLREHGIVVGISVHWPHRDWNQWQISFSTLVLSFGRHMTNDCEG